MRHRGFAENLPGISAPEKGLREQLKILRLLAPFIWPRGQAALKARVCTALALMLAAKLFNLLVPYFYKRTVDRLSLHTAAMMLLPAALILCYGGARVLAQTSAEFQDWIFAKVAQRAVRLVALDVLRHLHTMSLGFHFDRQTGSLNRALERGAGAIESLMDFMLFSVTPIFLEILLTAAVLWHFYDASFAAVTFTTIIVYVVWTSWITQLRVRFRRDMNAADNEASARSLDSLLNYETVKYFNNEAYELARYDEAKLAYFKAALRSQRSLSVLNLGQGLIITVGVVLVMMMAGNGVAAGRMSIGDFVLVNAYLLQLYVPLANLGALYRSMRQSLTDVETVFALLARRPELEDKPQAALLQTGPGRIVFDAVTFGYDTRRTVIHDISFTVPAGHTIAIVGPTGSGKTTISRLLFRFYDPASGSVTIDGQDLRGLSQGSLRRAVGVVPQDTVLFNDTLYYNIAYGRPDATAQQVEEAARLARIDEFVLRLPDGYRTRVGERGLKLSGGEKQRVAIARVILKNPRILIFDEATSALDTRTEREIQASLAQISAHRTTVIITHRLTTVVEADTILVLDKGRIAESGSHRELLAQNRLYAEMWSRQNRKQKN